MAITISGTTGVAGVDGSVSAPATTGTDSNSGISYGADSIKFSTGGVERMAISNSGVSGISAGKVLQMIQTTKKDVESVTVTQGQYGDLDFVASITPSSASNKIRFQAVLQTALSSTHFYGIQVYRSINGGAAAALTGYQGDTNGSRTEISQANSANPNTQYRVMPMDYIDDISSWTSGAISYSIYGFHGEHASSKVMYLNRGGSDSNHQQTPSPMSTITLTEISA